MIKAYWPLEIRQGGKDNFPCFSRAKLRGNMRFPQDSNTCGGSLTQKHTLETEPRSDPNLWLPSMTISEHLSSCYSIQYLLLSPALVMAHHHRNWTDDTSLSWSSSFDPAHYHTSRFRLHKNHWHWPLVFNWQNWPSVAIVQKKRCTCFVYFCGWRPW